MQKAYESRNQQRYYRISYPSRKGEEPYTLLNLQQSSEENRKVTRVSNQYRLTSYCVPPPEPMEKETQCLNYREFRVPVHLLSVVHFKSTCIDCDTRQCLGHVKNQKATFTRRVQYLCRASDDLYSLTFIALTCSTQITKQKGRVVILSTNQPN